MKRILPYLACLLAVVPSLRAYSVLTHQAIIDTAWEQSMKPLLLKRFPQATADQLVEAHAYAYGGCIIQDLGYYPFGSKLFSDLVHYVRTGDFVVHLIRESTTVDEFAFSLGALAHYAADNDGHPIAVNRAVPIEFEKLKREFGPVVTYADDPGAHMKVEFGFDVLQVARGSYAPQSYHDFIGFKVSKPVLERAFAANYDLELKDVFVSVDLALGTYRHTVSGILPEITKAAWALKKKELVGAHPGLTRRKFVYNLSRASYRKEWDDEYQRPGIGARVLAALLRIVPKVGPFKAGAVKAPTSQTATLFEESFNRTVDLYRKLLAELASDRLTLPNRDFDTGKPTRPTEYRLADDTYGKLAIRLAKKDPATLDGKLRTDVLTYFGDLGLPFAIKRNAGEWQNTVEAVEKLKATGVVATR